MDENLLALLKKKPEKGLERLMDTYMGFVYTIIYNKLYLICSREDIEECASTVFFEAYEKRNSIDLAKGSIKAFLAVIAKRRSIDMFRKSRKGAAMVVSLDEFADGTIEIFDAKRNGNAVDNETKSVLIDSIKALGEPDSGIFIRKYYFGQSTKTIAKILGFKENTVDKRVSRGLLKLKDALGGVL